MLMVQYCLMIFLIHFYWMLIILKILFVNNTFTPNSTGNYTVNMWGTGDSTSTPMISLDMTVTDNIYARDLNVLMVRGELVDHVEVKF